MRLPRGVRIPRFLTSRASSVPDPISRKRAKIPRTCSARSASMTSFRFSTRQRSCPMSKIGPDHLARRAVVYLRQSTADQVVHNVESKRASACRARAPAWLDRCADHQRRSRSVPLEFSAFDEVVAAAAPKRRRSGLVIRRHRRDRDGGPVWLIAHSQGGNFALEAAARYPEFFRGIVVIEPASAPSDIGDAHQVPHLLDWGDVIERSPTWVSYRRFVEAHCSKLRDCGGSVRTLDLPTEGMHGNSRVPMMDANSDDVAALVLRWIEEVHGDPPIRHSRRPSGCRRRSP